MKLYNKDSKFAKKPYLVIFESIIIFIIFLILLAMVTPNFKKTNIRGRTQKGCASDIRVLTGAVENYNMDKATMMQNLDQNLLLQGHYINSIFDKRNSSCIYKSFGNLTEDGIIYCETHGDLIGIKIKPEMTMQDYKNQEKIIIAEKNAENEKLHKKEIIRLITTIAILILLFTFPLFHLISHIIINETKCNYIDAIELSFFLTFNLIIFIFSNYL